MLSFSKLQKKGISFHLLFSTILALFVFSISSLVKINHSKNHDNLLKISNSNKERKKYEILRNTQSVTSPTINNNIKKTGSSISFGGSAKNGPEFTSQFSSTNLAITKIEFYVEKSLTPGTRFLDFFSNAIYVSSNSAKISYPLKKSYELSPDEYITKINICTSSNLICGFQFFTNLYSSSSPLTDLISYNSLQTFDLISNSQEKRIYGIQGYLSPNFNTNLGNENNLVSIIFNYYYCEGGFFYNKSTFDCYNCHYSCSSCMDFSSCSTCKTNYYRKNAEKNGLCYLKSEPGFYLDYDRLYPCSQGCLTCSSSSCSLCDQQNLYYKKSYDNYNCYKFPQIGYYIDTNKVFQQCDYTCVTCENSSTSCISCFSNYYQKSDDLNDKKCYYSIEKYFLSGNVLKPCLVGCRRCSNGSECTSYDCDNTNGYYYLYQNPKICMKGITPGFFFYSNYFEKCDDSCQECLDSYTCTKCKDGKFQIYNSSNYKLCYSQFTGYYLQNNYFYKCLTSCATCQNGSECLTCSSGYYKLSDNTKICINYTPSGYYYNSSKNQYTKCNISCKSCSSINCFDCQPGKFKKSSNDIKYPFCYSELKRHFLSNNFFFSCKTGCYTCNDSSTCLSCDVSKSYFPSVTNQQNCIYDPTRTGFYINSNGQINNCDISCKECSESAKNCLSCNVGYYRFYDYIENQDNQCYFFPQQKYYINGGFFTPCEVGCLTCQNSTECLSCDSLNGFVVAKANSKVCEILITNTDVNINQAFNINVTNNDYSNGNNSSINNNVMTTVTSNTSGSNNGNNSSVNNNVMTTVTSNSSGSNNGNNSSVNNNVMPTVITNPNGSNNGNNSSVNNNIMPAVITNPNGSNNGNNSSVNNNIMPTVITNPNGSNNGNNSSVNNNLMTTVITNPNGSNNGNNGDNTGMISYVNNYSPTNNQSNNGENSNNLVANSLTSISSANVNTDISNYYDSNMKQGFYLDINNQNPNERIYKKCSKECKECNNLSTDCIECNENYYKIKNKNNCYSADTYLTNKIIKGNIDKNYLFLPDDEKNANETGKGFFLKRPENIFFPCGPTCKKCINNENLCIECNDDYSFVEDLFLTCVKNSGKIESYYVSSDKNSLDVNNIGAGNISKVMKKCDISCKYCKDKSDFCTECNIDKKFYMKSDEIGKCLDKAPNFYYLEQDPTDKNLLVYKKCNESCRTCNNSNSCTSCNNEKGFYELIDKEGTCLISNSGYFIDKKMKKLVKCDKPCKECDENGCLLCEEKANFFKFNMEEDFFSLIKNQKWGKYFLDDILYYYKSINSENIIKLINYDNLIKNSNKNCLCFDKALNSLFFSSADKAYVLCDKSCLQCDKQKNRCLACNKFSEYLEINELNLEKIKCVKECPEDYIYDKKNYKCDKLFSINDFSKNNNTKQNSTEIDKTLLIEISKAAFENLINTTDTKNLTDNDIKNLDKLIKSNSTIVTKDMAEKLTQIADDAIKDVISGKNKPDASLLMVSSVAMSAQIKQVFSIDKTEKNKSLDTNTTLNSSTNNIDKEAQKKLDEMKSNINEFSDVLLKTINITNATGPITIKNDIFSIQIIPISKENEDKEIKYAIENKFSLMNYSDCEEKLKREYNISSNVSLLLKKAEFDSSTNLKNFNDSMASSGLTFDFYSPIDNTKLDISICSEVKMPISFPIKNSKRVNANLVRSIPKTFGIDIFNKESPGYRSRCYKSVIGNGDTDVSINYRRTQMYQNNTASCSPGCKYDGVNPDNGYTNCICDIAPKIDKGVNKEISSTYIEDPLGALTKFNYDIVLCYKESFIYPDIFFNFGFLISSYFILMLITSFLLFRRKFFYLIINYMNNIILSDVRLFNPEIISKDEYFLKKGKPKKDRDANLNKLRSFIPNVISGELNNNLSIIGNESDTLKTKVIGPIKIRKDFKRNIQVIKEKKNYEKKHNKNHYEQLRDFINKNKIYWEKEFSDRTCLPAKIINKKSYSINKIKHTDNQGNKQINILFRNELDSYYEKGYDKNKVFANKNIFCNKENIQKDNFLVEILNFNKNNFLGEKINRKIHTITLKDYEELNPYEALLYDKREFFRLFWDFMLIEHPLINLFFFQSLLDPLWKRLVFFFFLLNLNFALSAVFYNDDYIDSSSQIAPELRNSMFYTLTSQYIKICLAIIFAFIFIYILELLGSIPEKLEEKFTKQVTRKKKNFIKNQYLKFDEKMKWKYLSFTITAVIFSIISWYYSIVFCSIYSKSVDGWINGAIIGILLDWFVISIVIVLIKTFVRYYARKSKYLRFLIIIDYMFFILNFLV